MPGDSRPETPARPWPSRLPRPGASFTSVRSLPTNWTGHGASRPNSVRRSIDPGPAGIDSSTVLTSLCSAAPQFQRVSLCGLIPATQSRRAFLANTAFGVGAMALADLMRAEGLLADTTKKPGENLPLNLNPRAPHFAPRAKAMISLFMHGGPSHVDLFDPKPAAEPIARHRLRRRGCLQLRQPRQQEALRLSLEVRQARPVRYGGLRTAARDGQDRRRPVRGPVDAHRAQRARGFDSLFPRRAAGHRGTAHDGKLDRLRPGQRIAVAAIVHGSSRSRGTPRGWHDQLVERVHAHALPGHGAPLSGAADPQPRPAPAACGAAPAAEPRLP